MNHTIGILKSVKYMTTKVLLDTLARYCGNTPFNEVVILYIAKYLENINFSMESLFLTSIKNDSLVLTNYFLSRGMEPTLPQNKPIVTAVKYKSTRIAERLLAFPVDPTVNENYCLRKAVDNQDLCTFNLILSDQRVDPTFSGYYCIHQLCSIGNLEMLQAFLNNPLVNINDCGFLGLYTACEYGNIDIVEYLLNQHNIDPSLDNNYCIGIASANGYTDIVELLLKSKKVNPQVDKSYPFRMAAANGHLEIVQLLSNRIDPTAMNNAAIRMASSNGHYNVVKFLLKNPKINPAAVHNYALRKACQNGHSKVVELLLTDDRVQPSSHRYQAIKNCLENKNQNLCLKLLLDRRVDLHFENNYCLYKASEYGFIEIYKLYTNNIKSNSFCLKIAAQYGHLALVKLILEGEVDPTINDYEIIRHALANGDMEIFKLLIQDKRIADYTRALYMFIILVYDNLQTLYLVNLISKTSNTAKKKIEFDENHRRVVFWTSMKRRGSIIVTKELGELQNALVKKVSGDLPDIDTDGIRKSTSVKSEKKTSSTNCSVDKQKKSSNSPSDVSLASDIVLLQDFPSSIPKSNTMVILDTQATVKRREHRLSIRSPTERRLSILARDGSQYRRESASSAQNKFSWDLPNKVSGDLPNKASGDLPESSRSGDLPESETSQKRDEDTIPGDSKKSLELSIDSKTDFKANLGMLSRRVSSHLNNIPEGVKKKSGDLPDDSSTSRPSGDLPEDITEDSLDEPSIQKRSGELPNPDSSRHRPIRSSTSRKYSMGSKKRPSGDYSEKHSGDLPETDSSKIETKDPSDNSPKNTIKKNSGKKINEQRMIPDSILVEEKE
ncbi:hypothetical protein HDV06_001710 [Boothiomyces sp. JEL0866]|nr:hypothetical protein HDV06_001710 [Boothiomyces sp. JEL0866]